MAPDGGFTVIQRPHYHELKTKQDTAQHTLLSPCYTFFVRGGGSEANSPNLFYLFSYAGNCDDRTLLTVTAVQISFLLFKGGANGAANVSAVAGGMF